MKLFAEIIEARSRFPENEPTHILLISQQQGKNEN